MVKTIYGHQLKTGDKVLLNGKFWPVRVDDFTPTSPTFTIAFPPESGHVYATVYRQRKDPDRRADQPHGAGQGRQEAYCRRGGVDDLRNSRADGAARHRID